MNKCELCGQEYSHVHVCKKHGFTSIFMLERFSLQYDPQDVIVQLELHSEGQSYRVLIMEDDAKELLDQLANVVIRIPDK